MMKCPAPGRHPQVVIEYNDGTSTIITFTNTLIEGWDTSARALIIYNASGREEHPWSTIKKFTVISCKCYGFSSAIVVQDNTSKSVYLSHIVSQLQATARRGDAWYADHDAPVPLPNDAHRIAKSIQLLAAYDADITEIITVVDNLRPQPDYEPSTGDGNS